MLVQTFRLQRGWTQEELAIVSGVSTRTIQRIERGQEASLDTLKALAAAFEIDVASLKETSMIDPLAAGAAAPLGQASRPGDAQERLAFEHVRQIKAFYYQIVIYVVVSAGLFAVNLLYHPQFLWAIFPLVFWGIALAIRALRLFANWPWGADWERRQVEKYLGRKL